MRRLIVFPRRDPRPARRPRKPRRRAWPRWSKPALRFGAGALALALIAGSATWLWTSGRLAAELDHARAALIEASAAAGFAVAEVYVAGRGETSRAAVLEALRVELGTPMAGFDPQAARDRLLALGWVREATVERRFPDTVIVRLRERTPLALWQRRGRLVVIDREGAVIDGAAPGRFARLPVLVGADAPEHAARLLAVVATEPDLGKRVQAAVRVGGRRWNLRLDNDIDIELPEQGVAEAWRRLARFEREHQLLARDIAAIDLRLPDRVVVRPARAAAGAGEDT